MIFSACLTVRPDEMMPRTIPVSASAFSTS
jgi:hypothetical protein